MVAHVEVLTINPGKKEQFLEGMRRILEYYERKFPEVKKTLMVPIDDYVDVNPNTKISPDQWLVQETFESEAAMKKCREEKFADPEWKEIMKAGPGAGVELVEFTHCFCEVIK